MRRTASWILAALVALLAGCTPRQCRVWAFEESRSTKRVTVLCDGEVVGHGDKLRDERPERRCREATP